MVYTQRDLVLGNFTETKKYLFGQKTSILFGQKV